MQKEIRAQMKSWSTGQLLIIVAVAVVGTVIGANLKRSPAGWDITEPGSPLYVSAVNESVEGLNKNAADDNAKGELCPDCGKVHAPAGGGAVGASGAPASTNVYYCEDCKSYHANPKPGENPIDQLLHQKGSASKDEKAIESVLDAESK